MNVEKIFQRIPDFKNIIVDTILFESKYPVLFTCKNENDIYLFICCLVNASVVKWIGTKTDYDTLIELLENKVTIRTAFLGVTEEKILIEYDGQHVSCKMTANIQNDLLPTAGEYMDAEEEEYAEEIAAFKQRNRNREYRIESRINSFFVVHYAEKSITLTDDFFTADVGFEDMVRFRIGKIQKQKVILA